MLGQVCVGMPAARSPQLLAPLQSKDNITVPWQKLWTVMRSSQTPMFLPSATTILHRDFEFDLI